MIIFLFAVLVPILCSVQDKEEILEALKTELKSGTAKVNCLMFCEKYAETTGDYLRIDEQKKA